MYIFKLFLHTLVPLHTKKVLKLPQKGLLVFCKISRLNNGPFAWPLFVRFLKNTLEYCYEY